MLSCRLQLAGDGNLSIIASQDSEEATQDTQWMARQAARDRVTQLASERRHKESSNNTNVELQEPIEVGNDSDENEDEREPGAVSRASLGRRSNVRFSGSTNSDLRSSTASTANVYLADENGRPVAASTDGEELVSDLRLASL